MVVDAGAVSLVSSVPGVAAGTRVDSGLLAARYPAPEHRILEFPIFVDGALVGAAFEVQRRASPWWLRWRWLLDSGRYGLATLIVIGVVMVWWLAHTLRGSLAELQSASRRIAPGASPPATSTSGCAPRVVTRWPPWRVPSIGCAAR